MLARAAPFTLIALAALGSLAPLARADSLRFTANTGGTPLPAQSSTVAVAAPFNGTLLGTYTATNTAGSRTIFPVGNIFFPPPPAPRNDSVAISGSAGTATPAPTITSRPSGTFNALANVPLRRITLSNLAVDLLGDSPRPALPLAASISSPAFRTASPSAIFPALSNVALPLDPATLQALTITQLAPATATLAPTADPKQWSFTLTFLARLGGSITLDTQTITDTIDASVAVSGLYTDSGDAYACALTITINQTLTLAAINGSPTPVSIPNPLGGSDVPLLLTLNITGGTVNVVGSASVPATGTTLSPADIAQNDATIGPDATVDNGDFQLFIASFFAPTDSQQAPADIADNAANPRSDGVVDNGDFQRFINAFFSG
jgi:hypothetical protein